MATTILFGLNFHIFALFRKFEIGPETLKLVEKSSRAMG